ncbi:hypothetical protein [Kluyvera sp. CHPC 1.251]|uniref:hypothetical protein n=1 Tax=Kluyvera sp. CHPC 1.251 TaxID=2995175 RepID=UPI002FD8020A
MTDKHTTITELQTRFCLSELNVASWSCIHFQLNPESILEDELLTEYRFYRIEEMTDEKAAVHQLVMSNVIANMSDLCVTLLYMLPSDGQSIRYEEETRLLAKQEPDEGGSKKLGVEMFCNLLAEVRKYGEGLIIVNQIPNKLIPDVIKNTNTKIVHCLFSAVDRNLYLRTINRR